MNNQTKLRMLRTEMLIWSFNFAAASFLFNIVRDPFFEGIFLGFAISSLCMLFPTMYSFYKLKTNVRRGK